MVRSGVRTVFFESKSEGKAPSLESGVKIVVESLWQASKHGPPCIQKNNRRLVDNTIPSKKNPKIEKI